MKDKGQGIDGLTEWTCALGATAAVVIPASVVVVEERFAVLCAEPHRCPSYGLAPGCPPYAMKPEVFRALLRRCPQALVFKIDAPLVALMGEERLTIVKEIHRIAAAAEQEAIRRGCLRARGFAAGSCKELFCAQQEFCRVLEQGLVCPYADQVRPSLSAVGVNFALLAETVGWELHLMDVTTASTNEQAMGLMAGMVLLG